MAEARLAAIGVHEASWKAAAGALWILWPDPTGQANHYLNPVLTKKIRKGALPDWADAEKKTVTIGRHDFYRL